MSVISLRLPRIVTLFAILLIVSTLYIFYPSDHFRSPSSNSFEDLVEYDQGGIDSEHWREPIKPPIPDEVLDRDEQYSRLREDGENEDIPKGATEEDDELCGIDGDCEDENPKKIPHSGIKSGTKGQGRVKKPQGMLEFVEEEEFVKGDLRNLINGQDVEEDEHIEGDQDRISENQGLIPPSKVSKPKKGAKVVQQENQGKVKDVKAASKPDSDILGEEARSGQSVHENIIGGGVIMPKLGNETAKAELGRSAWKVMHLMTMRYPEEPTPDDRTALKSYFHLFSRLYPCGECATEFQKLLKQYPPQTSSRKTASMWLCSIHNMVNENLGKPEFDCLTLNEVYDCGCGPDGEPIDDAKSTSSTTDTDALDAEEADEEEEETPVVEKKKQPFGGMKAQQKVKEQEANKANKVHGGDKNLDAPEMRAKMTKTKTPPENEEEEDDTAFVISHNDGLEAAGDGRMMDGMVKIDKDANHLDVGADVGVGSLEEFDSGDEEFKGVESKEVDYLKQMGGEEDEEVVL